MKRTTCYKYCKAIHDKLHAVNGVYKTPNYSHDYVEFQKVYVVGSYVKGKLEPNDLDILIYDKPCGVGTDIEEGGILDKDYYRRYGVQIVRSSRDMAYMWLTQGMRKIHRLCASIEKTKFDVEVEIYPKFNLKSE